MILLQIKKASALKPSLAVTGKDGSKAGAYLCDFKMSYV